MARLVRLFLFLAIVVTMSTFGVQGDADCDSQVKELTDKCRKFVTWPANPKVTPSDECCAVVQKIDLPCACSKVDKEMEKIVCMEKVVYVGDYCKRPLKLDTKCGTYTVPHPPSY
ncbi:hypothetical protein ACP4OV_019535 [Aristida adscensionis]